MDVRRFRPSRLATFALCGLFAAHTAAAKDSAQAAVTPLGTPTPILVQNGNPYAPGNFGLGTIQLFYTVVGNQFTAGTFATFRVDLQTVSAGANPPAAYPTTLNLTQTGSQNLTLTPVPASFSMTATGWADSSVVTISIPASVVNDPSLNVDGADLVANLQLVTSPQGAHIDTSTTIQVHIKLVHPTGTCLHVYNFITDEAFTSLVTSTGINVGGPANNRKIVSTTPYGQLSDNVLVVNTCDADAFDLRIGLDSYFQTNPSNNPGNAVFTYYTAGLVDPDTFDIAAFTDQKPRGQSLCLANIGLPANTSFLATVHMKIVSGVSPSTLPALNNGVGAFTGFSAEIDTAGSTSTCTAAGLLHPFASPNPATAPLAFTMQ